METHANHLHKAPGKKFWHYFFEFFMLFLAVFCGFLAENQRERLVEHQREKKYARQLLADLRADSVVYTRLLRELDTVIVMHREFEKVMNSNSPSNYDILNAYIKLQSVYNMIPTISTYSEMKSSGSFRYLENEELAGLIKKYYEANLSYLKTNEELGKDFFNTHLQPFTISHFRMADIDSVFENVSNPSPVFLNRNKETEILLMNITGLYKMFLTFYRDNAVKPSYKKANDIIKKLKDEYHLK